MPIGKGKYDWCLNWDTDIYADEFQGAFFANQEHNSVANPEDTRRGFQGGEGSAAAATETVVGAQDSRLRDGHIVRIEHCPYITPPGSSVDAEGPFSDAAERSKRAAAEAQAALRGTFAGKNDDKTDNSSDEKKHHPSHAQALTDALKNLTEKIKGAGRGIGSGADAADNDRKDPGEGDKSGAEKGAGSWLSWDKKSTAGDASDADKGVGGVFPWSKKSTEGSSTGAASAFSWGTKSEQSKGAAEIEVIEGLGEETAGGVVAQAATNNGSGSTTKGGWVGWIPWSRNSDRMSGGSNGTNGDGRGFGRRMKDFGHTIIMWRPNVKLNKEGWENFKQRVREGMPKSGLGIFFFGFGTGLLVGWLILRRRYNKALGVKKAIATAGDIKMVFVVRTDLQMDRGKIAACCAHAAISAYRQLTVTNPELMQLWDYCGQPKMTIAAEDLKELEELSKKSRSAGLTSTMIYDPEYSTGYFTDRSGCKTVLGIGPGPINLIERVIGHNPNEY